MRNEQGTIDWQRTEDHAAQMTFDQLNGALADICNVLPNADMLDRINGVDNGGYYRDVASVYRREIAKRREMRFQQAADLTNRTR